MEYSAVLIVIIIMPGKHSVVTLPLINLPNFKMYTLLTYIYRGKYILLFYFNSKNNFSVDFSLDFIRKTGI